MSNVVDRIANLSQAKRKLFEEKLRERGIDDFNKPIIPLPRDKNAFKLSSAQQRLFFLEQLYHNNPAYNMTSAIRLKGILNVTVLKQCINNIIHRHEILRTAITFSEDGPVQVIAPSIELILNTIDLQNLPETQRGIRIQHLISEETLRPFNLSEYPLLRIVLIKLADKEHIFILSMHHIISDAWSIGVFINELTVLYETFYTGKISPLPELPVQYVDFANWQRMCLLGNVLRDELKYWKRQLKDAPVIIKLPIDKTRPVIQTFRGAVYTILLEKILVQKLYDIGRQCNATFFMTLLAAFKILLYRYTGQERIVVGTPIAGRNRPEIEKLIGLFINILVLHTDLSDNPSFQELLKRVQKTVVGAFDHPNLPLEKLIEEFQPERDMSYSPLFQVMFIFQNSPMPSIRLPNLTIESIEFDSETSKFDLTLSIKEEGEHHLCTFEYNMDLFNCETIARMAGHFQVLLENIVANPDGLISSFSILTEKEHRQLLFEWNDTSVEYPKSLCVHQLFEEQAEKTPDNIAIVYGNEQLTYSELNKKANQLANYLNTIGIERNVCIGICIERSFDMMVGILGILKSGATYIPLDPMYPKERLAFMLNDAKATIVITLKKFINNLPKNLPFTIYLDLDWQKISRYSEKNLSNKTDSQEIAYIIYTSGSTGTPKGVMIKHNSVVNFIIGVSKRIDFLAGEKILALTTISFDIFVLETLLPLTQGLIVVIVNENAQKNPELLSKLILSNNIDLIQITPSMMQLLIYYDENFKSFKNIKKIMIGGEPLTKSLLEKIKIFTTAKIFNMYGPTETTIWSTISDLTEKSSIDIGKPIANTSIYIINKNNNLLPIGIEGELCISGNGLAKGYLGKPDLTKEKFVPNPFKSGEIMYKTGDLAKWLVDGNIEFLGRIDNQVKIRGFRIELQEIELQLLKHESINEAVVLAKEDANGNKNLCAYIVANEILTVSSLRKFLLGLLPDYMIPSYYIQMNSLPLTHNGKVNKSMLPELDKNVIISTIYVPPENEIEKVITEVWQDILSIKKVGRNDNFFELGGDSIKAILVTTRLRRQNLKLEIKDLFQHPRIRELNSFIESINDSEEDEIIEQEIDLFSLSKIVDFGENKLEVQNTFPLNPAQERILFYSLFFKEKSAYFQQYSINLSGALDINVFEKSYNILIKKYETLRAIFTYKKIKQPLQIILKNRIAKIYFEDISDLLEDEKHLFIKKFKDDDQKRGFDLLRDLLMRISIVQTDKDNYKIFWSYHHILMDGWCIYIVIKELFNIYKAFLNDRPINLEKTYQYTNYIKWLKKQDKSAALSYWNKYLFNLVQITPLKKFKKSNRKMEYLLKETEFLIDEILTDKISTIAKNNGVTMNIIFQTIWGVLLQVYNNSNDVVFGTVVSGRPPEVIGIDEMIGLFINVIPVRIVCEEEMTFLELLKLVQNSSLSSEKYSFISMIEIEKSLKMKKDLIDHVFVFENYPQVNLIEDINDKFGLTINNIELSHKTNYDFNIIILPQKEFAIVFSYNILVYNQNFIEMIEVDIRNMIRDIIITPCITINELKSKYKDRII